MRTTIRTFLLLVTLLHSAPYANADWVNFTGAENARNIAEIYVNRDHVKIKLEIFVEDLLLFKELIPDELFRKASHDRPDLGERLQRFSEKRLQISTGSGDRLIPRIDLVEPRLRVKRTSLFAGKLNPYTRRPIPGPPDDKRVLYVELTYPFTRRPDSLTIIPELDSSGLPIASIGFICYHQGVPVVDFRNLTSSNTVNLDWDDPWYSAFEKRQLKRALQAGVRTYLYIEPYEVRHEILVRVKDMMSWLDFSLKGNEFIEEEEFDRVRQQVAKFFLERENVLIDGKRLKPILDRTAFVESSPTWSRFIEIPERLPLNTAMVGVVITYLTKGIPQEVVTSWDLFSERVNTVAAGMTDPAGPFPYSLTPDDNILRWRNHLKQYRIPTVNSVAVADKHRGFRLPVVSLVCGLLVIVLLIVAVIRYRQEKRIKYHLAVIALLLLIGGIMLPHFRIYIGSQARAGWIGSEDARLITQSLLKNIYRAFDFRDEEDVYDKLAISVSGEMLSKIYLESRKSMVIEQAGGAQAKIQQVEVLEADVVEAVRQEGELDVRTRWTALGKVGHWGHVHMRQNVYEAILTIGAVNGSWKIIGIEVLGEERVAPGSTGYERPTD
ncbi:hypothetical protein [Desulfosediminicola sp.]|uniref:hypothetical protein n=1 Tax=Desulfosediminicola sp. TaxID=2886825 RepID=UPI003AF20542